MPQLHCSSLQKCKSARIPCNGRSKPVSQCSNFTCPNYGLCVCNQTKQLLKHQQRSCHWTSLSIFFLHYIWEHQASQYSDSTNSGYVKPRLMKPLMSFVTTYDFACTCTSPRTKMSLGSMQTPNPKRWSVLCKGRSIPVWSNIAQPVWHWWSCPHTLISIMTVGRKSYSYWSRRTSTHLRIMRKGNQKGTEHCHGYRG